MIEKEFDETNPPTGGSGVPDKCPHCKSKIKMKTEIKETSIVTFCARCEKLVREEINKGQGDLTDLIYLENMISVCQDIMNSNNTTINAKTAALEAQLGAMKLSLLIKEDKFIK